MEKICFSCPNEVFEALASGKKMAIFELDASGKPIFRVSDVIIQNSEILSKNREIIRPAVKYVRENYHKKIKLDDLMRICGVSESYLCKLFKEATGESVAAYIIGLRMDEACRLLETTDNSVVAIACEVGYVDCGYFNKLFKKHVGCTPLEYRNRPYNIYKV